MFSPLKVDLGFQELQQLGEVGITDEQLLVVMVEDPSKGSLDFLFQNGGRDLSPENMLYSFPDKGFVSPVQEIVELAQNHNIASGD